jgi:hypothetical protein
VITQSRRSGEKVIVTGISHDNGDIVSVTVNGQQAKIVANSAGVVDWSVELALPSDGRITATAADRAGNVELTPHQIKVESQAVAAR